MAKIEVIVTGNRNLYRSIYQSIDRTTCHRKATGAARSVLKVECDAKVWSRTCGNWGSYTLAIDGVVLSSDDHNEFMFAVEHALDNDDDPVRRIACAIEALIS